MGIHWLAPSEDLLTVADIDLGGFHFTLLLRLADIDAAIVAVVVRGFVHPDVNGYVFSLLPCVDGILWDFGNVDFC